jgi:beta-barrel assembly-enhancing protease
MKYGSNYLKLSVCMLAGFFILHAPALKAQQDFNHFKSLVASGAIPDDFTTSTRDKIAEDIAAKRTNLSVTKERIFIEGIHRSIDQLLNSGSVIYGDEVTKYVRDVAGNLLKNEPDLLKELRFYTIKSNETNALSTDQGIVFVTTGLISQLTSEAQLAYVLSHEIAHYTEKHVVETFEWKTRNRYEYDRIAKLSTHSREHEFAADKLAMKLYHEAGYSDDEVLSAFDVLMYSYLPFDEVEVPNSYFSTDAFYIPDDYFATKKYPIKAEEDYDDDRSSHPNIKKRKDAAVEAAADYSGWGSSVFTQGESRFYYVRNLARFESVRTDIIDASFGEALYSIFLLEKEFPQSVYLKQMKALAWLGLAQFKEENQQSKTIPNSTDYEGESAAMFFLLKKLNDDAMLSLAIRNVWDLKRDLPNDEMIAAITDRLMKVAAEAEHFSWENYSTTNFRESAQLALAKDTAAVSAEEKKPDAPKSKYDKIKTKKNIQSPDSFDSSKYYFYGLADILADSNLRATYNAHKATYNEKEAEKEAFDQLTDKERYERKKQSKGAKEPNPLEIGMNECILVQPSVADYKRGSYDWESSEEKNRKSSPVCWKKFPTCRASKFRASIRTTLF